MINAPGLTLRTPFSSGSGSTVPASVGSTSAAPAKPHSISNLIPDALTRLRCHMVTMYCVQSSDSQGQTPSSPPAMLPLTSLKGAGSFPELNPSAQHLLRIVSTSGVVGADHTRRSPERLSVTASVKAFRALASVNEMNSLCHDINTLALPIADIARGAGLALKDIPAMDERERLAIVMELVKGGARFDQARKHLGVPDGPDAGIAESQILQELGLPLVRAGATCREVKNELGIPEGPALEAFQVDVVREIGLPLLRGGSPADDVLTRLGISSGVAEHGLRSFLRDIEAGQDIRSIESFLTPTPQAFVARNRLGEQAASVRNTMQRTVTPSESRLDDEPPYFSNGL